MNIKIVKRFRFIRNIFTTTKKPTQHAVTAPLLPSLAFSGAQSGNTLVSVTARHTPTVVQISRPRKKRRSHQNPPRRGVKSLRYAGS